MVEGMGCMLFRPPRGLRTFTGGVLNLVRDHEPILIPDLLYRSSKASKGSRTLCQTHSQSGVREPHFL